MSSCSTSPIISELKNFSAMNAFGGMFATAGYHHQDPYSRMMVGDAAMGVHAAAEAHHAHAMHHHQVTMSFIQVHR